MNKQVFTDRIRDLRRRARTLTVAGAEFDAQINTRIADELEKAVELASRSDLTSHLNREMIRISEQALFGFVPFKVPLRDPDPASLTFVGLTKEIAEGLFASGTPHALSRLVDELINRATLYRRQVSDQGSSLDKANEKLRVLIQERERLTRKLEQAQKALA